MVKHRVESNLRNQTGLKIGLFIGAWIVLTFAAHSVLGNIIIGYDFPYIYHGGHAVFVEEINLYSEEVAERIFFSDFGREYTPSDQLVYFMYPLYILFFPLPLYFLSMDLAAAAWLVLNILTITSFIPLIFPKFPKWLGPSLILFYESWYTIFMGNYALILFVVLTIAVCRMAFMDGISPWGDALLGGVVAWATGKPQMTLLLVGMLLFVALKKRHWYFLVGFLSSLIGLMLISFFFEPGWLGDWVRVISSMRETGPEYKSVLMNYLYSIFQKDMMRFATISLFILSLFLMGILAIKWWKGKTSLLFFVASIAFFQNLFDLSGLAMDRLVLIIPLILFVVFRAGHWRGAVIWVSAIFITIAFYIASMVGVTWVNGDNHTILVYLVFLVYLWFRHRQPENGEHASGAGDDQAMGRLLASS